MRVETTLDKVQIPDLDLQTIIKAYISQKLGRQVRGQVHFQSGRGSLMSAWAELEPYKPKDLKDMIRDDVQFKGVSHD